MNKNPCGMLVLVSMLLLAPAAEAQDFGYFGEVGPSHWADLAPEFELCGSGARQSPVDFGSLTIRARRFRNLPVRYVPTEGEIFDNGHTIEVETEGANRLTLGGVDFELVQFHFHTPSEHTLLGRGSDMELHLVHRGPSGELAVIGVLLRRGASSGALAPLFEQLPEEVGVREPLAEEFDPEHFLPHDRTNFRYAGSLTTPPCTQGVRWIVLAEPIEISDEHMARFAERIHFNARPVQRRIP